MAENWEQKLLEQRQRMDEITPPAEQVAKVKALMRLNQLSAQAQMHGALMRAQRPQEGVEDILKYYSAMDVPSRATTVPLPGIKQALSLEYLTRPFVHRGRLTAANLMRAGEEKMTEPPTDDPETLSWYQPAKLLATAKGVNEGWRKTDEAVAAARRAEMQKKVDEAKKMFEEALRTEYQTRPGSKYASASSFIDQLADHHVKRGFLDANSLLQMYTTAGTLAGAGARQAAKDYIKEIDPREMKVRAIKELLHQRVRQRPPTVRVEIPDPDSQDKVDAETAQRG